MLNFLFIAFCVLAVFIFGFFMGEYKAEATTLDDKLEEFYHRVRDEIRKLKE